MDEKIGTALDTAEHVHEAQVRAPSASGPDLLSTAQLKLLMKCIKRFAAHASGFCSTSKSLQDYLQITRACETDVVIMLQCGHA